MLDGQLVGQFDDHRLDADTTANGLSAQPREGLVGQVDRQRHELSIPLGAFALNTSADSLRFDPDERSPETPSLRLRLEALDQLEPDEQANVLAVIECALLRHQVRQLNLS